MLCKMTTFVIPGCSVMLPVSWSITAYSSLSGCKRGAGLLVAGFRIFAVAKWLYMR